MEYVLEEHTKGGWTVLERATGEYYWEQAIPWTDEQTARNKLRELKGGLDK